MSRAALARAVSILFIITISNVHTTADNHFYEDVKSYFANSSETPSVEDVFGLFHESVFKADISGSKEFLTKFHVSASEPPPGSALALDCGAGIGRVTKHVLIDRFDKVDLLDQEPKMLKAAEQSIDGRKLGSLYLSSLQDFVPQKKYDVIWIQFVLQYLHDDEIREFLKKMGASLNYNGVVIVKEITFPQKVKEMNSVMYGYRRPVKLMKRLFEEAQLKNIASARQYYPGYLDDDWFQIYIFALKPM